MAETKVKLCNCDHEYQDKRYGQQKRVHNKVQTPTGSASKYRCTVCENVK